jgi:putative ABC transport system ATP-binding protein
MLKAGLDRPAIDISQLHELTYTTLGRVANGLGVPFERAAMDLQPSETSDEPDFIGLLENAGAQLGLVIKHLHLVDADTIAELVRQGYPVILADSLGLGCRIVRRPVGRLLEVNLVDTDSNVSVARVTVRELQQWLVQDKGLHAMVVKEALECSSLSTAGHASASGRGHHGADRHLSPVRRFWMLLRLDSADVWTIALFALVAGTLTLATPLAVESLVNVVSWGIYLQPLLVLALMLMVCLGFAAALRVLQTVVVEVIQRRQMVRIVSDLAHRFPRAKSESLRGEFPRELANRFFDVLTIQKATAVLLLDGLSIVLTTFMGMLLLAFYHPFLLGYDLILLICMISITWLLGRGGIRTAIEESIIKYRIAHWLQDVIASPGAFRVNGGEALAIDRANRLAVEYIEARKQQFRVVLRQVIFAVGLQVVASTVLLGLGGWLVIEGQLTLGQLVASELVVTLIVGAFSKAGKSLEKFYDVMAGVEKVGHLLDLPVVPPAGREFHADGPSPLRWVHLKIDNGMETFDLPPQQIPAGSRVAVTGHAAKRSPLMEALAGLRDPVDGFIEIAGHDAVHLADGRHNGKAIGIAGPNEIFHGTIRDNISLGRADIGRARVREVLHRIGLWEDVSHLPDGMDSHLQTGGFPLTPAQVTLVLLARAIAAGPRLLLIDSVLDQLDPVHLEQVWQEVSRPDAPWTLVVSTCREDIVSRCDHRLVLE